MITTLLHDARKRGQVLASLRASETGIYGRFGFGVAGEAVEVTVTTREARPLSGTVEGTMDLVGRDELLDIIPELYERIRVNRVGTVSRPQWMWARYLEDALVGSKGSFVGLHRDRQSTSDGFVHYTVEWSDDGTGKGELHDLWGATPEVERALWSYLLDIDLVRIWKCGERPVDDVMRLAACDLRAYRVTGRWDEQWLRLLDVDAALRARRYGPSSSAVRIAVSDPTFDDNCGIWSVGADGATRSAETPDLSASIAALSAAYLGGTPWWDLVASGQAVEHRAGAVVLFAQHPLPFCGSFF
jgi:predicted acetyltransferase